jgi:hypothetical protein
MQNIDARNKRAITTFTPFRGRVGLRLRCLISKRSGQSLQKGQRRSSGSNKRFPSRISAPI